MAAAPWE